MIKLLLLPAMAAQLMFTNNTPKNIRVLKVQSKCSENLIPSPAVIKPKGVLILDGLEPVIYLYTVCGLGICIDSAVGMDKNVVSYEISAVPSPVTKLDTKLTPNIWPGNIDCANGDAK